MCYMAIHITYTVGMPYKPKVILHIYVSASITTLMESTSWLLVLGPERSLLIIYSFL